MPAAAVPCRIGAFPAVPDPTAVPSPAVPDPVPTEGPAVPVP